MLINQFHIVTALPPIFECIQEMGIPSNIYSSRDDLVLGWVTSNNDAVSFILTTTYQRGVPYYEVAKRLWDSQRKHEYPDVPTFIGSALRRGLQFNRMSEYDLNNALTKFFKGNVRC